MLYLAMLFWIGLQLNAPVWYWIILWSFAVCKVIQFGITLYKKGVEKGKE